MFAMVPFCQIRERGFEAHSDGESILALKISSQQFLPTESVSQLIQRNHNGTIQTNEEPKFYPSDEEYERIVTDIYQKEICGGEGSSFVVPRLCFTDLSKFDGNVALTLYNKLLAQERGSYW